ncbi:hypothetical protein BP00DRAFT_425950 [Aspergillus indologenus CBS 114.80]|uniref:Uncharacterized protein n=1 Tax=Aspergillus indologenus CBS 114.80 TaxID=1450541 RepID=A0A2V5I799_9EURO|nr:hypothetical protein BP00DRAFT_425950 [Aspergillus indologenus CBS 114.80]
MWKVIPAVTKPLTGPSVLVASVVYISSTIMGMRESCQISQVDTSWSTPQVLIASIDSQSGPWCTPRQCSRAACRCSVEMG